VNVIVAMPASGGEQHGWAYPVRASIVLWGRRGGDRSYRSSAVLTTRGRRREWLTEFDGRGVCEFAKLAPGPRRAVADARPAPTLLSR